jgi:hypothetical protein
LRGANRRDVAAGAGANDDEIEGFRHEAVTSRVGYGMTEKIAAGDCVQCIFKTFAFENVA